MGKIVVRHKRVLVAVTIVTINSMLYSLGLVQIPIVIRPYTFPVGVSGFIATRVDFKGSLLQFFDRAVSALKYYPLLKAWERILVARDEEAGWLRSGVMKGGNRSQRRGVAFLFS